MGYYTYYTVRVARKKDISTNLLDYDPELNKIFSSALAEINPNYFDENDSFEAQISTDSMKWYDHDDDMLELSKRFPEYLFILSGAGEEYGDLWVSYYLNGKMQHCPAHIWYDEFDEESLT